MTVSKLSQLHQMEMSHLCEDKICKRKIRNQCILSYIYIY